MSARPHGAAAVRQALLTAAIDRYASGAAFSARRVADQAGVNSGQVHHRFGGMVGLRQAMLHALADQQHTLLASLPADTPPGTFIRAVARVQQADPRFVRVLARQLVEHPDEDLPQDAFPVVTRLRALVEASETPELRAQMALALCAGLGLTFFGPWVARAMQLPPEEAAALPDRLTALVVEVLDGL